MVEFENMNFSYNERQVFKNLNCHIKDGSKVVLLLNNGTGKTTLFNLLNGTLRNNKSVIMDNLLVTPDTVHDIRLATVFIPTIISDYFIFDNVYDELKLRLLQKGKAPGSIDRKIKQILESLNLETCLEKDPKNLPLDEQYLLVLANILINEPKYIVLDDSLTLCPANSKELFVKYLKKSTATIIYLTSKLDNTHMFKRIIVIHDSNVVLDGPGTEIYKETKILRKCGFSYPFTIELSYKLVLYNMLGKITDSYRKLVLNLGIKH